MTADGIAAEFGLDLLRPRPEPGQVASKYIGEAEKNL
jgi:hypothetical protein